MQDRKGRTIVRTITGGKPNHQARMQSLEDVFRRPKPKTPIEGDVPVEADATYKVELNLRYGGGDDKATMHE